MSAYDKGVGVEFIFCVSLVGRIDVAGIEVAKIEVAAVQINAIIAARVFFILFIGLIVNCNVYFAVSQLFFRFDIL